MLLLLLTLTTFAAPIPVEYQWIDAHGPDKPSPDEGYEFKKKKGKGGNALAKFGVLMVAAGGVSAVRSVSSADVVAQQRYKKRAAVLAASGIGLIVIEKLR